MITCKICKKEFASMKALSSHIRQTHHISSENYYRQYINSNCFCLQCGKPTKFNNLSEGFRQFCSYKCLGQNEERIQKANSTFLSKPQNSENARNRRISYNQSEVGRENSRNVGKRTGAINITNAHKKDGEVFCPICSQITKHMIGIGCLGCYNRNEKHKESIKRTVNQKYGCDCVFQSEEIKAKIIQTSLQKYNTTNPGNCRSGRKKAGITMRLHGHQSGVEDLFAQGLQSLNIRYTPQYKDDSRYPFYCDFYLNDLDIFVEINAYWSHGKHWFDKNSSADIDTLNAWMVKAQNGHKQYQNSIQVWTISDVAKHDMAKQNKLNYVVLWNKKDVLDYLEKLKREVSHYVRWYGLG